MLAIGFLLVDALPAADPDLQEPGSAAIKVMKALRARSANAFLATMPKGINPDDHADLPDLLSKDSLFVQIAESWDGQVGEIRAIRQILMPFYTYERPDGGLFDKSDTSMGYKCIRLQEEDSGWGFFGFRLISEKNLTSGTFSEIRKGTKDHKTYSEFGVSLLTQYQHREMDNLIKMSVDAGPLAIKSETKTLTRAEKKSNLFSESELEGLDQWDGKCSKVFITETARVDVSTVGDNLFVLDLIRIDGDWRLENFYIMSSTDFSSSGVLYAESTRK
jgi:hypothetical protein